MARINIENSLFRDQRWLKLIAKLGCHHKALGLLTGAWILAQDNWLNHNGIPAAAWNNDFDVLIEVELATQKPDGFFYVKGSEKAFKWLHQAQNAGKQSGISRSNKTIARGNGRSTPVQRPSTEPEPPYSFLSSPSSKKNTYNTSSTIDDVPSSPVASKVTSNISESRLKKKQEIIYFSNPSELWENLKPEKVLIWLELYDGDEEFLRREVSKAFMWYSENKRKLPKQMKGWHLALGSWFERSWKHDRKIVHSNNNSTIGMTRR